MNLLTEPLLRVETSNGPRAMSLPALLAALGQDSVHHLPGLQRHQEDAFHVFLCQLAAVILARQGESNPIQDEAYWRQGLRNLAGSVGDDAWTLVVDDLSRPAFMQPPLPKEDWSQLKPSAWTPDALDLLNTAKNHDLKRSRGICAHPDEWFYALMNLQTMSGYFGKGNFGIARMNSGFGNRPIVELIRSFFPGARWRDAIPRLLNHRQEILGQNFGYDSQGLVLIWVDPWNGQTQLPLSTLDPFFIEICRRVRLKGFPNITHVESLPSRAMRIKADQLNGIVGDAWVPIDLGNPNSNKAQTEKALTISPQGLTPEVLRRLIFEDHLQLTGLQRPLPSWKGNFWLLVSVLVRGQGKTEGFYERRIFIPEEAQKRVFGPPTRRDPLALLAKTAVEYAGKMQNAVLKPAVFCYQQGGAEQIQFDRDSAQAWWERFARRFETLWSDTYFPWLWRVPDPFDQETQEKDWVLGLKKMALEVLHEAERSLPEHAGLKYKSRVQAEHVFFGGLFRQFPIIKGGESC